jgi:hypothetical protein
MCYPFMILSHHRSGSNFLHDLIQAHPLCESISEPFSMHNGYFRETDLVPWKADEFCSTVLHPSLEPYPETIRFLVDLRSFLVTPYEFHTRGMKETMLFEKLKWMKEFIPDLRLILLVRDPRAVVYSILKRAMYRMWDYDEKVPAYVQKYRPEKVRFTMPTHLCTWSWKIRMGLAEEALACFNHVVLRLEDVVLDSDEAVPKLMEFLGYEPSDSQWEFLQNSHQQSRGKAYSTFRSPEQVLNSWKKGLTHEDTTYIESNLREEMVRFGYL